MYRPFSHFGAAIEEYFFQLLRDIMVNVGYGNICYSETGWQLQVYINSLWAQAEGGGQRVLIGQLVSARWQRHCWSCWINQSGECRCMYSYAAWRKGELPSRAGFIALILLLLRLSSSFRKETLSSIHRKSPYSIVVKKLTNRKGNREKFLRTLLCPS